MGYDVVTQEFTMTVLANYGKSLSGHEPGSVKVRADFDKIDWDKKADEYFIYHESDIEAFCSSQLRLHLGCDGRHHRPRAH